MINVTYLVNKATDMAENDIAINGTYCNAPYIILYEGERYTAKIRYEKDETVLILERPALTLRSYMIPAIKEQ